MFNIFHANWYVWYVAIGVPLIFIIIAYVITRVWGSHKARGDGQRAIERLRKLECAEPPEPELAVKPGLSPQVETKLPPVLGREELIEPELAATPGLSPQVETKVQSVLGREELVEPGQAATPGLSPQVEAKVQPVLGCEELVGPKPAATPGLSPQVETRVRAVLGREELVGPKPAAKPGLSPQVETRVRAVLGREELVEPKPAAKPGLPLQVGTKVRAVRNFGPVKKGAPGIITRLTDLPFFWQSRPAYLCIFADNIEVPARPKLIEAFDHGYKLEELEQPDFASILSRQMTLRAQQLFSRQRPTRLGNTLIRGA
ncbi:MAG TPA: hypothetical protein VI358_20745 [Pseudolabrys sp.]